MKQFLLFALCFITLFAVKTKAQYTLIDAFPNLTGFSSPVDLRHSGDCSNRIFVAEQNGIIKVFPNKSNVTNSEVKIFLNIDDSVASGGEMGLLGLTFHPDYENNGYFYVNYTADPPRRTIIARFQVSATNPDSAIKSSKLNLITFSQPFSNHNGGWVGFGPNDGYLYIATGDGGSGGDPQNNGQRINTLLGKILRIDVDNQDPGLNYAIPQSNPFYDSTGTTRREIYAWGLRNPWRCSFDPVTGWLWAGDVGQSAREEVDIIENGENYGWRCYEGNLAYNTSGCLAPSNYVFPVWDYPRSQGFSVTGGYVYRGPNHPGLIGKYIYADWGSDIIWSLEYDGINPPTNTQLVTGASNPTSFGTDEASELYVVTSASGRIFKFNPTAPIVAPTNLTADATNPAEVELNWRDNSNNEDGFTIERKPSGGSFQVVGTVGANTIFFEDQVTQPDDYEYRIQAFNTGNQSGYSNVACVTVTIVPVELVSFTINLSQIESSVILNWETASEQNNRGFEIERSAGDNWVTIGFLEGNGTTTERSYYTFRDYYGNNNFSGNVLYRLKQIDFDGTFAYSGTVAIDVNLVQKDYYLYQNYPNPFNPTTEFRFSIPEESKVRLDVINTLGETIHSIVDEVKQSGFFNHTWNASDFTSGVYYVRMNAQSLVSDKFYSRTIKVVLLK
ncbi:MAG TPA: PQQ-dependent sugar dehydrogenase [Ignavibacteriaceae bacterium]